MDPLSGRSGNKSQIYLISIEGGEALPLTKEEEGINDFAWSPDGKVIAFTKNDPESRTAKATYQTQGKTGLYLAQLAVVQQIHLGRGYCAASEQLTGRS